MGWIWAIAFISIFITLAYQRASLAVWTLSFGTFLVIYTLLQPASIYFLTTLWAIYFISAFFLLAGNFRRNIFTKSILHYYRKNMPTMSSTEREALAAGTVSWEGELFRGNPHWNKLFSFKKPELTAEETAFLEGPVEKLCQMIDDWEIVHELCDLPPAIWDFLKKEGFFSLIIPKEYGGKAFSAYAHSQILTKVYGRSTTAGTTIAVPNSLGPAELLLHYGTPEQKDYYLPRLARGEEVPCFALTGLEAGSDAGSMTDKGIVTWGEHQGEKVIGIRLNWNKRYITLAPVATVIGLAFKLYDPEGLLGKKKQLGITCALIPRDTPGVAVGRRHYPSGSVFQNGPTQGHDVFIPLDWIIGGPKMAGQGWRMLMECLAAGRAISLPASAVGGAKAITYVTSAYARIRRQFKVSIGRFEGVAEALTRIVSFTYMMDATRTFTAGMIDLGDKPAVASAITKYQVTELGRMVGNDAMDIHGGKGIMLGPQNYLGFGYQSMPIAITVEGANILTRNMIIFGQGAMRCHPYIFAEFNAASIEDPKESLRLFDKALMGHMSFTFSNFVRTWVLGLTGGLIVQVKHDEKRRYLQQATRFSSAFALLSDVCLLVYGGNLKRKENISARLGDILSYLYLLSAVLKHYEDQGSHVDDFKIVRWACLYCLYHIQQRFDEILRNFPIRWLAGVLRAIIFPFGKHFSQPSDKLGLKISHLFLENSDSRYRLAQTVYTTDDPQNLVATIEKTFLKVIAAEPIEKVLKESVIRAAIYGDTLTERAKDAAAKSIITSEQLKIILDAEEARLQIIGVDDFAPDALSRKNLHQVINRTQYENAGSNGTQG